MTDQRMTWDPAQYLAFAGERLRPALELLARVPLEAPRTVADLGCGAGNVTRYLRQRWPGAAITGVDNSPEMLAQAAQALPDVMWVRADLGRWQPAAPVQVLYSNAALHWLKEHAALLPRLLRLVAAGGFLAAQMPRNFAAPSHLLMHEAAQAGPWHERLGPLLSSPPVMDPAWYYDLLAPHCKTLDLWETEYHQVLTGENPVADFTKGTALKALLDALPEPERAGFEAEYRRRVLAAYPKRKGGETVFPFRRLFIVAGV
jgi:trans-aconitate 2-methyltransferase